MKKYKRLTERNKEFGIITLCPSCSQNTTCKEQGECVACVDEVYNRLAELEDKIEKGLMLELPCKVGDKVYRLCGTPKRRIIKEKTCQGICFNNFGIEIHTDGAVDVITKENKNIFLTKAEAEAKLKEIQNER